MDTTVSDDLPWFDHTWFRNHGNGVRSDTWEKHLHQNLIDATPETLFDEANTFIWASHVNNYYKLRF